MSMIPWAHEWATIHCQRYGLDPKRVAVNLNDILSFFESNAVALQEALEASQSLAGDPPKRPADHLPRIKAAVFASRAKRVNDAAQSPIPSTDDLREAKRLFSEFVSSRRKRPFGGHNDHQRPNQACSRDSQSQGLVG